MEEEFYNVDGESLTPTEAPIIRISMFILRENMWLAARDGINAKFASETRLIKCQPKIGCVIFAL